MRTCRDLTDVCVIVVIHMTIRPRNALEITDVLEMRVNMVASTSGVDIDVDVPPDTRRIFTSTSVLISTSVGADLLVDRRSVGIH